MRRVRGGITVGDPAGIGPEIVEKARLDPRVTEVCEPVVFAPASLEGSRPGEESAAGGLAAYETVVRATESALAGEVDAIATAPVNKLRLRVAGLRWKGHTDLLAHLCGTPQVRDAVLRRHRAAAVRDIGDRARAAGARCRSC